MNNINSIIEWNEKDINENELMSQFYQQYPEFEFIVLDAIKIRSRLTTYNLATLVEINGKWWYNKYKKFNKPFERICIFESGIKKVIQNILKSLYIYIFYLM